jgi:TonB family protein
LNQVELTVNTVCIVGLTLCVTIGLPQRTAAQVSHDKAEVFVVITEPPGAVIELAPNGRDGADTLGPAAMLVKHVRGGRRMKPRKFVIRALPVSPGQCEQRREFSPEERAPDTLRLEMSRCRKPSDTPQDWAGVFEEKDVDEKPARERTPLLDYPDSVRNGGTQGSVELRLIIDTAGTVEQGSLEVLRASHPAFADAAIKAVLGSQYRPGVLLGRKVRTRVTIPISFNMGTGLSGFTDPYVKPRTTRTLLR